MAKLNPDVREMVGIYLKEHGYTGLFVDDCGCCIDDLAPCGEIRLECEAGYKKLCKPEDCRPDSDEGCQLDCGVYTEGNWVVMRNKEGV